MENTKKGKFKVILINTFIIIISIIVGVFLYAKYVGTKGIYVKEYKLSSNLIPESFDGVKIVFFTDLLYGATTGIEDVKKIVNEINLYEPDIVLFGGDLIAKSYRLTDKEKNLLIEELSKIDSNLGKYSSLSDTDKETVKEILSSSNFIVENNKDILLYNKSNEPICLSIVGSYLSKQYDFDNVLKCSDTYNIVLTHESDITSNILSEKSVDAILAGNSVGGEIVIPFVNKPLFKFEGSKKYYKEYYNKNNTNIYVSNGIGTKKSNLRLFNKPSFNLYRLKSTN